MNFLKENFRMLNEQYYGKNKITLLIEKEFELMKKTEDETRSLLLPGKFSNVELMNEHSKKIEGYLKDLFNFNEVYINIQDIGSINAYTYAISWDKDIISSPLYNKEKNKKYGGIQYTDKAKRNCMVVLSNEIISQPNTTPAMLTAILLHEIGHNFYIEDTISFTIVQALFSYLSFFNIDTFLKTNNTTKGILIKIDKSFRNSIFSKINKYIINSVAKINGLASAILLPSFSLLILPGTHLLIELIKVINSSGINLIFNQNTYNNELFADNFATSYGYGPEIIEMSSMFNKSYGNDLLDRASKNKFVDSFLDFTIHKNNLFDNIDPIKSRVSEPTRALDQLSYLKANINGIKDKKQKESLIKDIKNAELQLKKFKEEVEKDNTFSSIIAKGAFDNDGELSYKMRKRHYDNNGNWKNLI